MNRPIRAGRSRARALQIGHHRDPIGGGQQAGGVVEIETFLAHAEAPFHALPPGRGDHRGGIAQREHDFDRDRAQILAQPDHGGGVEIGKLFRRNQQGMGAVGTGGGKCLGPGEAGAARTAHGMAGRAQDVPGEAVLALAAGRDRVGIADAVGAQRVAMLREGALQGGGAGLARPDMQHDAAEGGGEMDHAPGRSGGERYEDRGATADGQVGIVYQSVIACVEASRDAQIPVILPLSSGRTRLRHVRIPGVRDVVRLITDNSRPFRSGPPGPSGSGAAGGGGAQNALPSPRAARL